MASYSKVSCLSVQSAGPTDLCHHAMLITPLVENKCSPYCQRLQMTFQSSANLALAVLSSFLIAFRGRIFRNLQSVVSHQKQSLKLYIVTAIAGKVCPALSLISGVGILDSQLPYSSSDNVGTTSLFHSPELCICCLMRELTEAHVDSLLFPPV